MAAAGTDVTGTGRCASAPISLKVAGGIATFALVAVAAIALFAPSEYRSGPSPDGVAKMELNNIFQAIQLYDLSRRVLPRDLNDLLQMEARSGEPYLYENRVPLDPWGHAFVYRILSEARKEIEIVSIGEDGDLGTDDDIAQKYAIGKQ